MFLWNKKFVIPNKNSKGGFDSENLCCLTIYLEYLLANTDINYQSSTHSFVAINERKAQTSWSKEEVEEVKVLLYFKHEVIFASK